MEYYTAEERDTTPKWTSWDNVRQTHWGQRNTTWMSLRGPPLEAISLQTGNSKIFYEKKNEPKARTISRAPEYTMAPYSSPAKPALLWPCQGLLLASTCLSSSPPGGLVSSLFPNTPRTFPCPRLPSHLDVLPPVPVFLRARHHAQRCRLLTPATRGSPQGNQDIALSLKATPQDPRYLECHCWTDGSTSQPCPWLLCLDIPAFPWTYSPLTSQGRLCLSNLTWERAKAQ